MAGIVLIVERKRRWGDENSDLARAAESVLDYAIRLLGFRWCNFILRYAVIFLYVLLRSFSFVKVNFVRR